MRETRTSVRHFLERMFGIGINRQEPSGLRDLVEKFGRDEEIEEPNWGRLRRQN